MGNSYLGSVDCCFYCRRRRWALDRDGRSKACRQAVSIPCSAAAAASLSAVVVVQSNASGMAWRLDCRRIVPSSLLAAADGTWAQRCADVCRRRRAIYCRQWLRLLLMHILHTVPSVLTVLPPLVVVVVCPDEFDTNGFHHFWKSTEYLNWFFVYFCWSSNERWNSILVFRKMAWYFLKINGINSIQWNNKCLALKDLIFLVYAVLIWLL